MSHRAQCPNRAKTTPSRRDWREGLGARQEHIRNGVVQVRPFVKSALNPRGQERKFIAWNCAEAWHR